MPAGKKIKDDRLLEAVNRAGQGSIDADLGGGLIKQRVARQGHGRSGGYRTLIAFHSETRSVFLYGYAKNERDNIGAEELEKFKTLAKRFLTMTDDRIEQALGESELMEVAGDESKN